MAKQKLKIKAPVRKSKGQTLKVPSRKKSPVVQSEVWKGEVEELRSTVFSSLDQALDTLVDRVVSRLGRPGAAGEEEREFVRLLLETDPSLLQALSKAVKIR